jgi:DNA invertase Pin-like site-specific DNA recombinase
MNVPLSELLPFQGRKYMQEIPSQDMPLNAAMHLHKAAMYVRMSTDHQKYSTENQADAISEYAARNGINISKTYEDAGKSGLTIEGRGALKQLIDDVQTGQADFSTILVLDVTRWGRFQDADESAYYEYICRRSGIDVRYVAEQFENDGSPVSTIVKGVKRAMAGEYSRELSGKVFAGQCRLIEMGYKQGGTAGYGLRRMLINEHGEEKGILKLGEHKSLITDRVILVPGPEEEVETVRWIYRAFVDEGLAERQIAIQLNQKGILTDLGRAWTRATVHQILTNEKYVGNNVFNRTSFKLKKHHVNNTREMWVRKDNAFPAIVDPSYFFNAEGIIRQRNRKFSNDDMLSKLKALHERKGWLSGILINEADDMPSSCAYAQRFGSLVRAYELIGYTPATDYSYIEINRHLRKLWPEIVNSVIKRIQEQGGDVRQDEGNDLLIVNDELTVSVVICRCLQTTNDKNQWRIHLDASLMPDITIAVRMNPENTAPLDYYLLPAIDVEDPKIRLMENNHFALEVYRFDDLEPFFLLMERTNLTEAA